MVPEDSSAARMPLPGATRAVAILFSSVRFIEMSSQNDSALAGENRPFSGKCRVNVRRRVRGEGAPATRRHPGLTARNDGESGAGLRHLRGEFALGVALGHLGRGQHLLDLGCLASGIEFLEPLLAPL